jgi:hypothetical protein
LDRYVLSWSTFDQQAQQKWRHVTAASPADLASSRMPAAAAIRALMNFTITTSRHAFLIANLGAANDDINKVEPLAPHGTVRQPN